MAKPELLHRHTIVNMYTGEITQQSVSGVTPTQQDAVQYLADGSPGHFSHYAVEYQPGHSGYVQWWSSGKPAWRLTSRQLAPDPKAKISARPVPPEPMYIIANLGISEVRLKTSMRCFCATNSPQSFRLPPSPCTLLFPRLLQASKADFEIATVTLLPPRILVSPPGTS